MGWSAVRRRPKDIVGECRASRAVGQTIAAGSSAQRRTGKLRRRRSGAACGCVASRCSRWRSGVVLPLPLVCLGRVGDYRRSNASRRGRTKLKFRKGCLYRWALKRSLSRLFLGRRRRSGSERRWTDPLGRSQCSTWRAFSGVARSMGATRRRIRSFGLDAQTALILE